MKRLAPERVLFRSAKDLGNGLYRSRASDAPASGPWLEGRWLLAGLEEALWRTAAKYAVD